MSDCLFCKIIAGEIPSVCLYQDDAIYVFKDIAPKAEVHLLVVPKQHIATLNELKLLDETVIARLMLQLPELAAAQGIPQGYRTIINCGKEGGQVVFHLHIHLLGGKNLPGF
ncbi:MAG: histidine triad nucleotide-binding protein [Gammaproteobacteria bacterium]|nr:histidine triad nucleotide-binding protein [Gammaproteobacteria bacterium]